MTGRFLARLVHWRGLRRGHDKGARENAMLDQIRFGELYSSSLYLVYFLAEVLRYRIL